ncbi:hypothetical protein [Amycolatopsis pigmentata]|uniref:Uncharacterized protein n=1 Tax=Amycolatopsis pigmentata TaxID=450801 RepID=A0ABW5FZH3_9PSEU
MADNGEAPAMTADRVRVSRKSQWPLMADNGEAPAMTADRVRVARRMLEAAHG